MVKIAMRGLLVLAAGIAGSSSFAQDKAATQSAAATATAQPAAATAKSTAAAKGKTTEKKYASLAEARGKIGAIIADPSLMKETISSLSPEDQKTFTADVNAAISKLPGSTEDRTAKYLNVNKAALKGAATGNMANVLAVTFATVPPESLTVISERYAVDLFNRDADASQKYSDPVYEQISKEVVGKVEQATSGSDDAGVRNTLAILMFVKGSNGQEGLADKLVETLPDQETKELAKKEWIPAAMAKGEEKSYDSMMAYADAGKAANIELVISLAGPQILDAALTDISSAMNDTTGSPTQPALDQAFGGFDESRTLKVDDSTDTKAENPGKSTQNPRTQDPDVPWNPSYNRDSPDLPTPEPTPYPYGDLG